MATKAAAVREHGLMFKGPLVNAIREGKKTQTRRVISPRGSQREWLSQSLLNASPRAMFYEIEGDYGVQFQHPGGGSLTCVRVPYRVGDRIWVRETFRVVGRDMPAGWDGCVEYRAGVTSRPFQTRREAEDGHALWVKRGRGWNWVPSMSMPRWAARIVLEITAVRVERLADITEADAIAEGSQVAVGAFDPPLQGCFSERAAFRQIWDRLASDGTRWADNPWVVALTFRPLSPTL